MDQPGAIVMGAGANLPERLLNEAIRAQASPDVLEKYMALWERYEARQARKEFDDAVSRAKAEMPQIVKSRKAGFDSKRAGAGRTEYAYEDLSDILGPIDPVLAKHGLSIRFRTSSEPNQPITCICVLSHRAGYFEENSLSGPRDESGSKNPLQAIGSTLTYLQRYTVKAALGLAAARDDDAEASGPDPVVRITGDQVIELIKACDAAKVSQAQFLKAYGLGDIHDLPEAEFADALKRLNARIPTPPKDAA